MELEIDGMIVSNTTVSRPEGLKDRNKVETGGLSGAPLFDISTTCISEMYKLTDGKVPIIGVGGISSASQAYAKIKAGASLVQLYTGLIYGGPSLIREIKRDLGVLVRKDGYSNIKEAIGADHKKM
jgi:dihydroorotate dehydrogenase